MAVTLRAARPEDEAFLLQVYASTRAEEMALVDWTAEQKQAFVRMQFDAQRTHYLAYYPAAEYSIILRDDVPIGRLIVDRSGERIFMHDIALLPEHRGGGIGTALLRDLQAQAARTRKPMRLYVEFFNPALHWYERLGFVKMDEDGVYYEMEWRASGDHGTVTQ